MNQDHKIIAEAVRCEINEKTGQFYVVFEITDPDYKHRLKKEWSNDLKFILVNKTLTIEEE